jgi:hypothetical protein
MSSHIARPTKDPIRKVQKKIRNLKAKTTLTEEQDMRLASHQAELRRLLWKQDVKKPVRHQTDDELLSQAMALNDKMRRGVSCKRVTKAKLGNHATRKSILAMREEKIFDAYMSDMFKMGEKQYFMDLAGKIYKDIDDDDKKHYTVNEIYTYMRHMQKACC